MYQTPLKTNMSPENQWLEDVFPTEIVSPFWGTCLVSGVIFFWEMGWFNHTNEDLTNLSRKTPEHFPRLQICPLHIFRKQAATDGTKQDLNIGDSGPNLLPPPKN